MQNVFKYKFSNQVRSSDKLTQVQFVFVLKQVLIWNYIPVICVLQNK